MADIRYPPFVGARGPGHWLRPSNAWASRQGVLRLDYSNDWRYAFGAPDPPDRVVPVVQLLRPGRQLSRGFRFIILGDTGEGDRSQYGLLPLLRALKPDFMIINGDVAYPAGRAEGAPEQNDFLLGFFQPYRNFRCAIWATHGNHEYYSANSGRDFYELLPVDPMQAIHGELAGGIGLDGRIEVFVRHAVPPGAVGSRPGAGPGTARDEEYACPPLPGERVLPPLGRLGAPYAAARGPVLPVSAPVAAPIMG